MILLVVLLRAGEIYTQLARYQRYWDMVNQKPMNKADLVYIAFGDSVAQGVGASRPDKGYVGLIAEELAKDGPVRVINLSKSGARINDVIDTQLPKYESLRLANRQVITIDIGANDVVRGNLKNFENDMDRLMARLPENTVIADIPSFKGSRYGRLESRVGEANEIMDRLATKHGVDLVKIHDRIEKGHGLRTFSGDLFHPSDYGYSTNWAPAFLERIKRWL